MSLKREHNCISSSYKSPIERQMVFSRGKFVEVNVVHRVVGYRIKGQNNYIYVQLPIDGSSSTGYRYATITIPKNKTTTFEIVTICGIWSSWLSQNLRLTN